jgi:TonB family protein
MKSSQTLLNPVDLPVIDSVQPPKLTVQLEPRWKVFAGNLAGLVSGEGERERISSPPGTFWPDVFVASPLPWFQFIQSAAYHALVILAVWGFARVWPQPSHITRPVFSASDVVTSSGTLYLPPLDTRQSRGKMRSKGDPVRSPQAILSVPREPDNRTQTIVTPPDIKLNQELRLPNIVAWSQNSVPVPMAATARKASDMKIPSLRSDVVAPPPEISHDLTRRESNLSQDVVAPPPTVNAALNRRIGDLIIGHAEVVAPAPQLPVSEQRTLANAHQALGGSGAVAVPPPPSTQGVGSAGGSRLIALGIHPDAAAPPVSPAGNRRGSFEAGPEGKTGASGSPNVTGDGSGDGTGGTNKGASGVPPGLFVGKAPAAANTAALASSGASGNGGGDHGVASPPLVASVTPPRTSAVPQKAAAPVLAEKATELDKQVFGSRQFYAMALNMPNLNSAGGSWVVRFAELKDTGEAGELLAPVATQKADPAYPLELMRRNIEGTVALFAVIHSDGRVSDVRVLRGVDDRLDGYAMAALSRWHFQPATKNGTPVALEAVVLIPFKTGRKF